MKRLVAVLGGLLLAVTILGAILSGATEDMRLAEQTFHASAPSTTAEPRPSPTEPQHFEQPARRKDSQR